MKCTLLVTQDCNLRCTYCYIDKRVSSISNEVVEASIDFIFNKALLNDETVNIGLFGGEPLLEFQKIKSIVQRIKTHALYDPARVSISIITNGTIFNDSIAEFLATENVIIGISCDGPPLIQDKNRIFKNGSGSSEIVENNIKEMLDSIGHVMINAVYTPTTVQYLAETVSYFSNLGVRQIYLSPDYSAFWDGDAMEALRNSYRKLADLYKDFYQKGNPHMINLIDNKISILMKNGYEWVDTCKMGLSDFAITAEGTLFPCERLIGNGENDHEIGNVFLGIDPRKMACHQAEDGDLNTECYDCGIKDYCMNWCGCSNYMTSGYYNRVSEFLCASEKAIIKESFRVFEELEARMGPTFYNHFFGKVLQNVLYH